MYAVLRSIRRAPSLLVAGILLLAAGGCAPASSPSPAVRSADPPRYRIIGYVGGRTDIRRIGADKLTHINYAFARVSPEGDVVFPDELAAARRLARLQALKARNPDLNLLVSVGGWGAGHFSEAALTDASRARFARSAADLVDRYALDGIDIDWEFPGQPGPGISYRPEDKQNFTLYLAAIRTVLDSLSDAHGRTGPDRYLLTIASNDDQAFFDHTEMDRVHPYLDFVNIMTYDAFSSGSPTTGHHTGLFRSAHPDAPTRTAAAAVERHLAAGIPPEKIVLGVAFYGRGWRGVAPERNGLHQPYEAFAGAWGYDRLREAFGPDDGFTRYWDDAAKAPYLWNPDSAMFISYDDPESLRHKAEYVKEMGLGGVMYWEHSHNPGEELLDVLVETLR